MIWLYNKQHLSEEERCIYNAIHVAYSSRSSVILDYCTSNITSDILSKYKLDHPWAYDISSILLSESDHPSSVKLEIEYYFDVEEKEKMDQLVNRSINSIIESINDGCSDIIEIESHLYRYAQEKWHWQILDDVVYTHSALGPILLNNGVCDAFAQATTMILSRMGVTVGAIPGVIRESSVDHAWNVVNIHDNIFHLDVMAPDKMVFNLDNYQINQYFSKGLL